MFVRPRVWVNACISCSSWASPIHDLLFVTVRLTCRLFFFCTSCRLDLWCYPSNTCDCIKPCQFLGISSKNSVTNRILEQRPISSNCACSICVLFTTCWFLETFLSANLNQTRENDQITILENNFWRKKLVNGRYESALLVRKHLNAVNVYNFLLQRQQSPRVDEIRWKNPNRQQF